MILEVTQFILFPGDWEIQVTTPSKKTRAPLSDVLTSPVARSAIGEYYFITSLIYFQSFIVFHKHYCFSSSFDFYLCMAYFLVT